MITKILFFSWLAMTLLGATYSMYWDDRLTHKATVQMEAEQANEPDSPMDAEFTQDWNKAHPNDLWH